MSLRSWIRARLGQRVSPVPGESDAPADTGTARTRATGGVPEPRPADSHSTTGTTPSGTFVGQSSGDDPGEAGSTGAEVRAAEQESGKPDSADRRAT